MRRLIVLLGLFLAVASPALAHVEVAPNTAPKGSAATFTFNVEDERNAANEVKVEIVLPDGVTQQVVTPSAPAGWTFAFTATPSVVFSHPSPGPDGDQSFTLAVNSLPTTDQMVFKAVVSYDNGEIDRWIDLPTGGKEPPHPAAVVKLTGESGTATTQPSSAATTSALAKRTDKGSNKAVIAGVIIAAIVLVGALLTFALRGRRA